MDLNPTEEQQQLIEAFAALYSKEASPERVREAEPLGFDQRLWNQLLETGVVAMAVPEEQGGWGASLLDLALVAEQHGRAVAPAPVIETMVAARLLARLGEPAADTLAKVLEGEQMVTISLTPARNGKGLLIPAGAIADAVLIRNGADLVLAPLGDDRVIPENSGSQPLADADITGGVVLATGAAADAAFETALDEWLALTANAEAGMAQRSLQIGVEYVLEREAFGQKIGAFQSIQHGLADAAAAADGSLLIARKAAWAQTEEPARFAELAAGAFAFATESAMDASYKALHYHGGYGFMLEYDIQLYYRRSRAWAYVAMTPAAAYRRATAGHLKAQETN